MTEEEKIERQKRKASDLKQKACLPTRQALRKVKGNKLADSGLSLPGGGIQLQAAITENPKLEAQNHTLKKWKCIITPR